jgi:NTE family protein
MGGNLMNPRRRLQVLDTALETSVGALDAGQSTAA